MKKTDMRLYVITDSTQYTEKEFLYRTEQALQGGATLLQLRLRSAQSLHGQKQKTSRISRSPMASAASSCRITPDQTI